MGYKLCVLDLDQPRSIGNINNRSIGNINNFPTNSTGFLQLDCDYDLPEIGLGQERYSFILRGALCVSGLLSCNAIFLFTQDEGQPVLHAYHNPVGAPLRHPTMLYHIKQAQLKAPESQLLIYIPSVKTEEKIERLGYKPMLDQLAAEAKSLTINVLIGGELSSIYAAVNGQFGFTKVQKQKTTIPTLSPPSSLQPLRELYTLVNNYSKSANKSQAITIFQRLESILTLPPTTVPCYSALERIKQSLLPTIEHYEALRKQRVKLGIIERFITSTPYKADASLMNNLRTVLKTILS